MATISRSVSSGFRRADVVQAMWQRNRVRVPVLDGSGHVIGHQNQTRVDMTIMCVVRDGDGVDTSEVWSHTVEGAALGVAAVDAALGPAWTAYLAARGYTEVP